MSTPSDPAQVWDLIRRSDDLVKYAPNRDPGTALAKARETLGRAEDLALALPDESLRARFAQMIELRKTDLDRYDARDVPPQ